VNLKQEFNLKTQWYEEFFENYADKYDQEPFTKGTQGEVDFIEREIRFNKKFSILDIGCGTGRHAIELARRGYRVLGVDLSPAQLAKARLKAKTAKVRVRFRKADARSLKYRNLFSVVIMMCEGAFPLMETDEMNFVILKNAARSLKRKGILIFTTLNGLFPLFHSVKDFINRHQDHEVHKTDTFDLMTFRDYSEYEQVDDDGNKKILKCNERYYIPSEITWLLKSLNFSTVDILGAETGKFNRRRLLTTSDYEMLVVAKKG
jgi:2-polyprenyl-3-methyl-5-hydroxy-6-metoxy-1,4-benzoquinol methylase